MDNEYDHGRDYMKRILDKLPKDRPQRQDSLRDQLQDLQAVANRLGMYDAADYLRNVLEN